MNLINKLKLRICLIAVSFLWVKFCNAQSIFDERKFLNHKIISVLTYDSSPGKSIPDTISDLDSLNFCTSKTEWETNIYLNQKQLVVSNRRLKEYQVLFSDQLAPIFDSRKPKVKGLMGLALNQIWESYSQFYHEENLSSNKDKLKGFEELNFKLHSIGILDSVNYLPFLFLENDSQKV